MAKQNYIKATDFRKIRNKTLPASKRGYVAKPRGEESLLQEACVEWFRWTYPSYGKMLFSIPNGGFRTLEMGKIMKKEGMMAGAADCLLLVARGKWHGLAIEFKTPTGTLQENQKEWGALVSEQGYPYQVIRTRKEFQMLIRNYLNL